MARVTCKGVFLYLRVSVLLGLHGVFVVLALIRALSAGQDGSVSWYAVFSPLFIFDGIAVVLWVTYLFTYLAVKLNEDSVWADRNSPVFPGQQVSLRYLIAFALGLPLKLSVEVLLALHLEGDGGIRVYVPGVLLMVLFLEMALVAGYEALAALLVMCWSSIGQDVECIDCEDCGCLNCLGYTNLYCRRCLYNVRSACT
jgi:hypothetical protein